MEESVFVITRTEGDYDLVGTVYKDMDAVYDIIEKIGIASDFKCGVDDVVGYEYVEVSETTIRTRESIK